MSRGHARSEPRIHPLSENDAFPDAQTFLKRMGGHLEAMAADAYNRTRLTPRVQKIFKFILGVRR